MTLSDELSAIIPLVLWSGFFTMCIVQLVKPFTRLYVHRGVLKRWLARLEYDPGPLKGSEGAVDHKFLKGGIPRSIELLPSEQFCGYIAQRLSRKYEAAAASDSAIPSTPSQDPHRDLRALQGVDELLSRIKRSLEIAIQVEVLLVSLIVFAVLYHNSAVSATLFMRLLALLVAAYSATIFRDLVAIIEKLKR